MKLTSRGAVSYSLREREAFALLTRKGQTTSRLVERLDAGEETMFAGNSLVGTLKTLARKVELNDEPFRIKKSQRRGPHPIEHWIEPKTKSELTKSELTKRSKSCRKSTSRRRRS